MRGVDWLISKDSSGCNFLQHCPKELEFTQHLVSILSKDILFWGPPGTGKPKPEGLVSDLE